MTTPTNTCEDCHFFEVSKEDETTGNCHRYPPTFYGSEPGEAGWPPVDIDDWCGDYKHDGSTS